MATLIPNYDPASIALDPERKVAEALCSQLPKDVRIFHSYPWLRLERDLDKPWQGEVIREGEADFVIVDPRYGIMVLEVKGGHMFYNAACQSWGRHGATHEVKDPFAQAARNLFALEAVLQTRSFPGGPGQMPFVRTRAVVFPDCDYQGTLPPGAVQGNLWSAKDLAQIGQKVESLFKSYPFKAPAGGIGRPVLGKILSALSSTFRLTPALWREVEEQERRIVRLTERQAEILEFLGQRKRVAIQGVAGSGKTMLAMIQARRFADEGKRVLLVCYNSLLADWLSRELPPGCAGLITILNYHKLCAEWVKKAGLPWPSAQGPEFWGKEAPRLFERALDRVPDRFDAVVVDEAQDFETDWWDGLELVNAEITDGPLYMFYDPAQRIFSTANHCYPALGEPFALPTNCRNTVAISNQCGRVIDKVIPVRPDTPAGRNPLKLTAATMEAQLTAVDKQVREWSLAGIKPGQIAVVTARKAEDGCAHGRERIGNVPVTTRIDEWRDGKALLVSTIGKFKGLEADALVLTEVPEIGQGFRKEHLYVACSRARHLLTVVFLNGEPKWF